MRKVVIPAAGLGTGLLPYTKEMPKEMLPIFVGSRLEVRIKPLLQVVFEELYEAGFRSFCFVVGRGKRAIEDYFTPDPGFLEALRGLGRDSQAAELEEFYGKISESLIVYVNQPRPAGLGDALLRARKFVKDEPFLVHAGDTYILPRERRILRRLVDGFYELGASALLVGKAVRRPEKYFSVILGRDEGGVVEVERIARSAEAPGQNLVLVHIYALAPSIFDAIGGSPGEIGLQRAVNRLVERGERVYALPMNEDEYFVDINVPETYWDAVVRSYARLAQ